MNKLNETVVDADTMNKLTCCWKPYGYEQVPEELQSKAKQLLGGKSIASMDPDMKRKLKNLEKRMRRAGVPGY